MILQTTTPRLSRIDLCLDPKPYKNSCLISMEYPSVRVEKKKAK
jgi:hypothetical protein